MNTPDQARWIERVRTQLDEDVRDLDAATASRLNRARQAALDRGLARRRIAPRFLGYALAASMLGALALSAIMRTPQPTEPAPVAAAPDSGDDLELLAGSEELEMIENLEFYAWLEQQSLDG